MTVSVIIVNFNGLTYTRQCLDSLYRFHASENIEVIVVDNNSTDGSQQELPLQYPSVRCILLSENSGFGPANNVGARSASGDVLFFVNNDTIFTSSIIDTLASELKAGQHTGIVAPRLSNADGSFQLSYGRFPTIGNERETKRLSLNAESEVKGKEREEETQLQDWVTGAALMIKKSVFLQIGGFDERYFMYFEDIDLCRTVKRFGFDCRYVPSMSMIHLGGKSYQKMDERITIEYRRSQLRYYDKHNSMLQRIAVRWYLAAKFMPKLLERQQRSAAKKILILIMSHQGH
jgi:GT2 family glycosyltransferase